MPEMKIGTPVFTDVENDRRRGRIVSMSSEERTNIHGVKYRYAQVDFRGRKEIWPTNRLRQWR